MSTIINTKLGSATLGSATLSRRSPRLLEKEAIQKITAALDAANIPGYWVFDDALFQKRWEYEQAQKSYEKSSCSCDDCSYEEVEELKKYEDYLPYNTFIKEEVVPVTKAFIDLAAEAFSNGRKEMVIIYTVALMRFIHGPGRVLLKYDNFRATTKAKCSSFPKELMSIGMADSEFGERLLDACWAVAELIAEYEDEDGYNIFHSY